MIFGIAAEAITSQVSQLTSSGVCLNRGLLERLALLDDLLSNVLKGNLARMAGRTGKATLDKFGGKANHLKLTRTNDIAQS